MTLFAGNGMVPSSDPLARVSDIPGSTLPLVTTVTVGGASATVEVEDVFNESDVYKLVVSGLLLSNNGVQVRMEMKIGGSYITTGTYAHYVKSNSTNDIGTTTAYIPVVSAGSNHVTGASNFIMNIFNPSSTAFRKSVHWTGVAQDSSPFPVNLVGMGDNAGTAALTGLRFKASTGTINAGKFRLYRFANS